ncbi:MAG TPA: hypothetical protein VKM56_05785, partial [Verrucomicrobiae bacterium]|nr:hypothetical protein [Verrucomicrobiae bacterium]
PFVQILLLLWNFGFVMNQVLTINALNTYLESSGFYAIPAALGGAAAGFLCLKLANVQAFAPAFVILGALAGGFIVGWTRWLYTRVRDLLLFGPQLVLHALGQIIRQSLEFVVSGASPEDAKGVNMAFRAWAGPREDRPLERFSSAINLKTVIWFFGMTSLVLNLLALFNLDLLNVLLLLPSLLFTVSILAGPFLLKPRVGSSLRGLAFLPRLCGWVASLFIYISISLWLPQRGALHWLGLSLLGIAVAILLHRGLRYCTYRVRLRRGMDALARLLTQFGIHASRAREFALQLIPQAPGNVAALEEVLARGGVEASHRSQIIQFLDQSIVPLLRTPSADLRSSRFANNRWVSEFSRSWVLSLLVMLWLFVVPVPGLFVFTAGGYRVSLGLWRVASFITLAIALAVVGAWLGDLIQRFDADGPRKLALKKRIRRAFAQFQQQLQSSGSPLAQDEISSTFALFTDIQTYMDQRSYAFAHRLLATVEARLRGPQ